MDFIWHYRLSVCVYLNAGPAFTLTYDLSLSLGYIATVKYMGEKKKKKIVQTDQTFTGFNGTTTKQSSFSPRNFQFLLVNLS